MKKLFLVPIFLFTVLLMNGQILDLEPQLTVPNYELNIDSNLINVIYEIETLEEWINQDLNNGNIKPAMGDKYLSELKKAKKNIVEENSKLRYAKHSIVKMKNWMNEDMHNDNIKPAMGILYVFNLEEAEIVIKKYLENKKYY